MAGGVGSCNLTGRVADVYGRADTPDTEQLKKRNLDGGGERLRKLGLVDGRNLPCLGRGCPPRSSLAHRPTRPRHRPGGE